MDLKPAKNCISLALAESQDSDGRYKDEDRETENQRVLIDDWPLHADG